VRDSVASNRKLVRSDVLSALRSRLERRRGTRTPASHHDFFLLYENIQIRLREAMEFAYPDHQGKASSYRADDSYLTIKPLEVW
jgi:hypothetical protein